MSDHIRNVPEGNVYLDIMILYAYLRASNADVAGLFQRIEDGVLQAFTATLTFDELIACF